jgi:hypothetical protein
VSSGLSRYSGYDIIVVWLCFYDFWLWLLPQNVELDEMMTQPTERVWFQLLAHLGDHPTVPVKTLGSPLFKNARPGSGRFLLCLAKWLRFFLIHSDYFAKNR